MCVSDQLSCAKHFVFTDCQSETDQRMSTAHSGDEYNCACQLQQPNANLAHFTHSLLWKAEEFYSTPAQAAARDTDKCSCFAFRCLVTCLSSWEEVLLLVNARFTGCASERDCTADMLEALGIQGRETICGCFTPNPQRRNPSTFSPEVGPDVQGTADTYCVVVGGFQAGFVSCTAWERCPKRRRNTQLVQTCRTKNACALSLRWCQVEGHN